jgi:hypothetical protein
VPPGDDCSGSLARLIGAKGVAAKLENEADAKDLRGLLAEVGGALFEASGTGAAFAMRSRFDDEFERLSSGQQK